LRLKQQPFTSNRLDDRRSRDRRDLRTAMRETRGEESTNRAKPKNAYLHLLPLIFCDSQRSALKPYGMPGDTMLSLPWGFRRALPEPLNSKLLEMPCPHRRWGWRHHQSIACRSATRSVLVISIVIGYHRDFER
jgi:hypothetical protein